MQSRDQKGQPAIVSIKFIKHSKATGKGGQIRLIAKAQLNSMLTGVHKIQFATIDVRDLDEKEPSRMIKKIHTDLITEVNGIAVV